MTFVAYLRPPSGFALFVLLKDGDVKQLSIGGGRRNVNAGEENLLLGKVRLAASLNASSMIECDIRMLQTGTIERQTVPWTMYLHTCTIYQTSSILPPRDLILVVRICPSPHTETIYGDVSVSNTPRALMLVRIAPPYRCSYVILSR